MQVPGEDPLLHTSGRARVPTRCGQVDVVEILPVDQVRVELGNTEPGGRDPFPGVASDNRQTALIGPESFRYPGTANSLGAASGRRFFIRTREFLPLASNFDRRAAGSTSGPASEKPPFCCR
jgi:hypothetical protein